MPRMTDPGLESLDNYIKHLKNLEAEERAAAAREMPDDLTPRILFEYDGLLTLWPQRIVYGHIRFAVEEHESDPYIDLNSSLENCLVDGFVLYWIYEDGTYRIEDPHTITRIEFVGNRNAVRRVEVMYEIDPPADATEDEVYVRHEIYWQEVVEDDNREKTDVLWWEKIGEFPISTSEVDREEYYEENPLDRWPYKAIRWKERQSILKPAMSAILRCEAAMADLGLDNDRHARRKMVYNGGGEIQKLVDQANYDGYYKIPKGDSLAYMDNKPYAFESVSFELDKLETAIRDATGLVELKDVHNASGRSKLIQLKAMLAQAKSVRKVARQMAQVLKISNLNFPPLVEMDPRDISIMISNLQSARDLSVIDAKEFKNEMRMLFNLIDDSKVGEDDDEPDAPERPALRSADYAE